MIFLDEVQFFGGERISHQVNFFFSKIFILCFYFQYHLGWNPTSVPLSAFQLCCVSGRSRNGGPHADRSPYPPPQYVFSPLDTDTSHSERSVALPGPQPPPVFSGNAQRTSPKKLSPSAPQTTGETRSCPTCWSSSGRGHSLLAPLTPLAGPLVNLQPP